MGITQRTWNPSRVTPDRSGALIGDYQAILTGVARILVNCGYEPDAIDQAMRRICGTLHSPATAFDRQTLEYVARLPDVIADWNDLPRFADQGQPRLLPLNGPEPSMRSLISTIFSNQDVRPVINSLIAMRAIRKRHGRYECLVRHLVFKGKEAYWRALISLHGLIQTMERNLQGQPTSFEQSAISARLPARDRAEMGSIARRRGLPALHALDIELRRRAREAPTGEGRAFSGIGMYLIDIPLSRPTKPKRPKRRKIASARKQPKSAAKRKLKRPRQRH